MVRLQLVVEKDDQESGWGHVEVEGLLELHG